MLLRFWTKTILLLVCSTLSAAGAATINQGGVLSNEEVSTITSKPHSMAEVIEVAGQPSFVVSDKNSELVHWYYLAELKLRRAAFPVKVLQTKIMILTFDKTTDLFKTIESYEVGPEQKRSRLPLRKVQAVSLANDSLPYLTWRYVAELPGLEIETYQNKAELILVKKGVLEPRPE